MILLFISLFILAIIINLLISMILVFIDNKRFNTIQKRLFMNYLINNVDKIRYMHLLSDEIKVIKKPLYANFKIEFRIDEDEKECYKIINSYNYLPENLKDWFLMKFSKKEDWYYFICDKYNMLILSE